MCVCVWCRGQQQAGSDCMSESAASNDTLTAGNDHSVKRHQQASCDVTGDVQHLVNQQQVPPPPLPPPPAAAAASSAAGRRHGCHHAVEIAAGAGYDVHCCLSNTPAAAAAAAAAASAAVRYLPGVGVAPLPCAASPYFTTSSRRDAFHQSNHSLDSSAPAVYSMSRA